MIKYILILFVLAGCAVPTDPQVIFVTREGSSSSTGAGGMDEAASTGAGGMVEATSGSGGSSNTASSTGAGGMVEATSGSGGSSSSTGAGGTVGDSCRVSPTFCIYAAPGHDVQSYCENAGSDYEPGMQCPQENLVGCCGDQAAAGGVWQCYYAPTYSLAASQGCLDWRTEAP